MLKPHQPFLKLFISSIFGISLFLALITNTTLAASNVRITGMLIDEPCTIDPDKKNITVDFGYFVDSQLYRSEKIYEPFEIHLSECSTALAKTIKISFLGTANPKQPGLLALDDSSQASGIGIGIETSEGQLISINGTNAPVYPMVNMDNTFYFKAFVQGESAAIVNRDIGLGNFSATATFVVEYN